MNNLAQSVTYRVFDLGECAVVAGQRPLLCGQIFAAAVRVTAYSDANAAIDQTSTISTVNFHHSDSRVPSVKHV